MFNEKYFTMKLKADAFEKAIKERDMASLEFFFENGHGPKVPVAQQTILLEASMLDSKEVLVYLCKKMNTLPDSEYATSFSVSASDACLAWIFDTNVWTPAFILDKLLPVRTKNFTVLRFVSATLRTTR